MTLTHGTREVTLTVSVVLDLDGYELNYGDTDDVHAHLRHTVQESLSQTLESVGGWASVQGVALR